MSGAIPFIAPTVSLIQAKNATEIGKFNQRVFNRNALVAEQAEIQKDVMEYNAKVEESRKLEAANFARISGTMARNRARMQALGYIASAGSSLLTNFGNPYGGNTNA